MAEHDENLTLDDLSAALLAVVQKSPGEELRPGRALEAIPATHASHAATSRAVNDGSACQD